MRLKAKGFGPLKDLNIEVRPLTVLIGKNNLGKSYAAQLLYVMLCVLNDLQSIRFPFFYYDERLISRRFDLHESEIIDLTKKIKSENLSDSDIVERLAELILKTEAKNLQTYLKVWLERVFGVPIHKLVNINSSKAKLECELFRDVNLRSEISRRGLLEVKLTTRKNIFQKYADELSPFLQKIRQKHKKKTYVEELSHELQSKLMMPSQEIEVHGYDLEKRRPKPLAYYIPAGRAGLIESYDTVVEALFFQAAGTPTSGLSISPLPGMANQFYSVLRSLSGEKSRLGKKMTTAFRDLLGGDVRLKGVRFRRTQRATRMRMIYHFHLGENMSSIDLIHAASMIKELAPIYLIVQELVNPRQYLIVEEPESHLHPGAQSTLTKVFVKLTNLKVNVLLTTHSPVLLRKLSHFIRRKGNEPNDYIDPRRAAIYWIKEGKSGSTSQVLKISKCGTLEEIPTYDEVVNELYEEEVSLHNQEL